MYETHIRLNDLSINSDLNSLIEYPKVMKTIALSSIMNYNTTYMFIADQLWKLVQPDSHETFICLPCTSIAIYMNQCSTASCPCFNIQHPYIIFDGEAYPVRFDEDSCLTRDIMKTLFSIRARTCKLCGTLCKSRMKICTCCDARSRRANEMLSKVPSLSRTCCICLERMRKPLVFSCSSHIGCARCVRQYDMEQVDTMSEFICPYRCHESKVVYDYIHPLKTLDVIHNYQSMHSDECNSMPHDYGLTVSGPFFNMESDDGDFADESSDEEEDE